mmetsp:Transcript_1154/g.3302  ORF Transcript_1154/g.3302 Transcript_1154/m.3302 type:complete len:207 (-) Transcript_1154:572-1192(-)
MLRPHPSCARRSVVRWRRRWRREAHAAGRSARAAQGQCGCVLRDGPVQADGASRHVGRAACGRRPDGPDGAHLAVVPRHWLHSDVRIYARIEPAVHTRPADCDHAGHRHGTAALRAAHSRGQHNALRAREAGTACGGRDSGRGRLPRGRRLLSGGRGPVFHRRWPAVDTRGVRGAHAQGPARHTPRGGGARRDGQVAGPHAPRLCL